MCLAERIETDNINIWLVETNDKGGSMRREIFEIVRGMDLTDIETQLALQCAPLIAGLKMSNLLIAEGDNLYEVKQILKDTGISCFVLSKTEQRLMAILYHQEKLEKYLSERNVKVFLRKCGYQETSLSKTLSIFWLRYQKYVSEKGEFPHEMGVFLGYPIEDVEGFMKNAGENFLYTGYWKVYANLSVKLSLFREFEIARETLIQLVSVGVGIADIIKLYGNRELKGAAFILGCPVFI